MSDLSFNELAHLKLLISIEGIGPQKIFSLLSQFQNFEPIFHADFACLTKVDGISKILGSKIYSSRKRLSEVKHNLEFELSLIKKMGGKLISFWDDEYPEHLKRIYFPPPIVYILGNFSDKDRSSIAIVGTRQPSAYGKTITEKFSSELVENGITIVSGLARGIDSYAHAAALQKGGRTIAVTGSGLDVIYPPENKRLYDQIKENGAILTEFELKTKPDAQNFPRRNRIISGLSLGTLVVETKISGGAMQTAAYALDQNREVFAVPGNLSVRQSEGPNKLIQSGEAKLVTCASDILVELELQLRPRIGQNIPKPSVDLNLFEERLIGILDHEPKQIDEIASKLSMNTTDCLVNLLTLEFKGLVKQLPGKMFVSC